MGDILKERMVDLLLSEPKGQIVAYNALASLDNNLISDDLLRQFFMKCFEAFIEDEITKTDDLISQFEDVARGKRPVSRPPKKFLLICKRFTPSITRKTTVCNVIEFDTLKTFILKDSTTVSGHGVALSNPDPTDSALADSIEELNKIPDKYQSGARLGGDSKRPFFWITPSIENERQVKSAEKCGDYIRDRLGLIHREPNQILIEIQIPGEAILEHENSRPTFFDALSHRRFRVQPDTNTARRRSAWGYTVDLAKFANKRPQIDGLPERIVKPIDCTASLGLKFKHIGNIVVVRGNSPEDNDTAFAKRLSSGANLTTLKQEILELFE